MGLLHFIDPPFFRAFPVPFGITWLFFLYVLTKNSESLKYGIDFGIYISFIFFPLV